MLFCQINRKPLQAGFVTHSGIQSSATDWALFKYNGYTTHS